MYNDINDTYAFDWCDIIKGHRKIISEKQRMERQSMNLLCLILRINAQRVSKINEPKINVNSVVKNSKKK
ncbi:hypothetical protein ACNF40_07060 [Cuniculiplasma sp. SKW4]|uniref:hypothetical protein n=1 Tax=Cuniculiplasma sp. SKW4 TaxID=3400171 RepID=UPI003FD02DCE